MSFKTLMYHKGVEEKYVLQICDNRQVICIDIVITERIILIIPFLF